MKADRITPDYLQSSNFRRSVSVKIAGKCLLQINIQMINPVFDEKYYTANKPTSQAPIG